MQNLPSDNESAPVDGGGDTSLPLPAEQPQQAPPTSEVAAPEPTPASETPEAPPGIADDGSVARNSSELGVRFNELLKILITDDTIVKRLSARVRGHDDRIKRLRLKHQREIYEADQVRGIEILGLNERLNQLRAVARRQLQEESGLKLAVPSTLKEHRYRMAAYRGRLARLRNEVEANLNEYYGPGGDQKP